MLNNLEKSDLCWCGSQEEYKKCHAAFDQTIESYKSLGCIVPSRDIIKNIEQIEGIRKSGKINTVILNYIAKYIKAGITTEYINQLVYEKTVELGAVPAQLGYDGFPKSVCTSLNEQVCHGIPNHNVVLQNGDIINIDVSTIYQGYFSDSSRMFCIGKVDEKKEKLVRVVQECVDLAIQQVKPWGFLGDIGEVINEHAVKNGYTIVEDIGGHGVGLNFHEDPWISYVSKRGTEMMMVPGMIFTIEPMLNMGTKEIFMDEENGWTYYTADGQPSAQCEVMILVTNNGYEVLAR